MPVNLNQLNDRLTNLINEMGRLQRSVQEQLAASTPPEEARLTREEWLRLEQERASQEQIEQRARDAAAQSAALGNTDTNTQQKATERTQEKK